MSSTRPPRWQLRYRARSPKGSELVGGEEICVQAQRERDCAFVAGKHGVPSAALSNRESLERYVVRR
jgi:hypothetical protein